MGVPLTARVAAASYDDLMHAIGGKSRNLVSQGLERLEQLKLITRVGSHQKRRYRLANSQPGWFKLPCQAIVRSGVIPFEPRCALATSCTPSRSTSYLAARRDNHKTYTLASYEKIMEHTGVPERYMLQGTCGSNPVWATGEHRPRTRCARGNCCIWSNARITCVGHRQLFQSASGASVTPKPHRTHRPRPIN